MYIIVHNFKLRYLILTKNDSVIRAVVTGHRTGSKYTVKQYVPYLSRSFINDQAES